MKTAYKVTIFLFIIVATFLFFSSRKQSLIVHEAGIVKEIKSLSKLETVSFTFEKIVESGLEQGTFKDFLFGDKILLVASADVIAGFDFSKLKTDAVEIDHETISITLPPPEILSVKLNNDRTKVYDRQTGLLVKANKNLESQARTEAQDAILKDACDSRILEMAYENGEKIIKSLLGSFGFTEVSVKAPAGICSQ